MIDYSQIKPGDTLRVLTNGLWGFTKAGHTMLTVASVDAKAKRCEVDTPAGHRVYFVGDDAAAHFDLATKKQPEMSPIAEALQTEILELVGRNAKLSVDLDAANKRIEQLTVENERLRALVGQAA